jgi:acyl-CoA synthetase (NDP forming)
MSFSARLDRLLRPKTVAVFGGHVAAVAIQQCDKLGFAGDVWPVHPRHTNIGSRRAYRSLGDLPAAPDAVFLGVNRDTSIEVMAELSAAGCGGAVAYASGYAESSEEGAALQRRLVEAAGDMPFFGPNCYGFINYFDRALVWPDQHGCLPVSRGVAIITQSGNIGLNITMQKRALPIGYLITLGNQAQLGHAAIMQAVLDDPRVTAIGLHMEGLGDPTALAQAMIRARAKGVPVVALKTGSSEAGARIALSHTASLASADSVVDAFFARIGVARVCSVPALLETLKLLHGFGPLPEASLASLSCSGGEAALMADTAARLGLAFKTLSPPVHSAIAATLPALVPVSNPLDYHTFGWRNRDKLADTFGAMLKARAALTVLILDYPRPDRCEPADWDIAAAALQDATGRVPGNAAILATLPEALPEHRAEMLFSHGIVPLFGLTESLDAVRAAASIGGLCDCVALPAAFNVTSAHTRHFSEWEGKTRLAAYGVPIPQGALAHDSGEACEIAATIGYPVAVKAVGDAILHKTEMGAVRLNLWSEQDVQEAASCLLAVAGAVLVERMVTGAVAELIVGLARDPVLGVYLVMGSGGVFAELIGDTVTLLVPATRADIEAGLARLRISKLICGFRGKPKGDKAAAISAIIAIQDFALACMDTIQELDVNPLIICEDGRGAFAADVLLRMSADV